MTPADKITLEQRADIVEHGLTRAEYRLFFSLFEEAVAWRHEIVASNRSGERTEEEDRARWAANHNPSGRLIAAVDAIRDHLGLDMTRRT